MSDSRAAGAIERPESGGPYVGKSVLRSENRALLTGRGQFCDDLPVKRGTLHAAILRSPHAHAEIESIDVSACLARPGVHAVITGEDMRQNAGSMKIPIDAPLEYYGLAVDKVCFAGEAVAVVCATDRYLAEDALDDIEVVYRPLEPVLDPLQAVEKSAPVLHPAVGSNLVSQHHFRHGEPEKAFETGERKMTFDIVYPRNSIPPIEGFVCIAEHLPESGGYDVMSNFPGPFGMHSVMAWSLGVAGNKLRLRTPPNAGGNFGVKLTMFPSIVVMCVASKLAGRPVKWVEDRLEHLIAANSAPNRVTRVEAAYTSEGEVTALRLVHWDDHGAHIRAPMPGPIYRMHGTTSNAYKVKHLDVTMNIVVTNKCPSGAVRGFGGPQLYYATERLMQKIAVELDLDPLEVLRRNLLPADCFPYRAPAGAVYDSGNYGRCVDEAVEQGRLEDLKRRREEARAAGKYYGIGYAMGIEPSQSNMGYIAIAKSAEKRRRSGPKDGAIVYATVSVDASGAVSVVADSVPQGQGHATTLSQVVADQLGLAPDAITVNTELDTQKDAWSIASGNYSSRFAAAVGSATYLAASRVREKLARIASANLNRPAEDLVFAGGKICDPDNPENAMPLYRAAAVAHWSPGSLPEAMEPGVRERAAWSAEELQTSNDAGEINCELAYGFIFDYCGVEIDPVTFDIKVDRYVTAHDCGTILNPALLEGQIGGSFAAGHGAALYEEFVYGEDGAFYSGSLADYLIATAPEMPQLDIVHCTPTPSPVTLLGAKGVGEGNTYTTPVCIANAVADALSLDDVVLPLTPSRIADLLLTEEAPPRQAPAAAPQQASGGGRNLTGQGEVQVPASPEEVWRTLLDPDSLAAVVPGCRSLEAVGDNAYKATVDVGVGPVRGRFQAEVRLFDLEEPSKASLEGSLAGPLGSGGGSGEVRLEPRDGGTRVTYSYSAKVSGKVAAVGGRMLDGAARSLIKQFFEALVKRSGGTPRGENGRSFWSGLLGKLGGRS